MKIFTTLLILVFFIMFLPSMSRGGEIAQVKDLELNIDYGITLGKIILKDGQGITIAEKIPLFSLEVNDSLIYATSVNAASVRGKITFEISGQITGTLTVDKQFRTGWKAVIVLTNHSKDTVKLSNIVPFSVSPERIYLTASGPWSLARTKIFRPGVGPVGVVLPDNAWEMGYGDLPTPQGKNFCAITRRKKSEGGEIRRWWTRLPPGSSVEYHMFVESYSGEWQNGLRLMFQKRYLYDLEKFDDRLYRRKDLSWVRDSFVITTQMAWDHDFYDHRQGGYQFDKYLEMGNRLFGGWDIYILWPTWPTLGLDQRNQWDLYRDLPGGLAQLKKLSDFSRRQGTRFFIAYNPWDQSTRQEDPYQGMARLIRDTDADGVILDTYGWSTAELQVAADKIKPGIVMYSEGMAVPKDMPGIITGRVHDAIYMPPPLNMNKLIKPDNTIFRVCQLYDGEMHRETSVAFFNGYGVEINVYRPGRPSWMEAEYIYLGKLARILRENSTAFYSQDWTPLIPALSDSIWVNQWPAAHKTLYTVFSLIPEGFDGPLFLTQFDSSSHYVSLIHHEELSPDTVDDKTYIPVRTDAFHRDWLHSRKEGNVDCIARFPNLLSVRLEMDSLTFRAGAGDEIRIWTGMPSYQSTPRIFSTTEQTIKLLDIFGRFEGKIVVQLFAGRDLIDERVVTLEMQTPRLISKKEVLFIGPLPPDGMIAIPGTDRFRFKIEGTTGIIPYADFPHGKEVKIPAFYIDKYPVTNQEFKRFLDSSGYQPSDTVNFLRHWLNGMYPTRQEQYPVVYISYEDAREYSRWAGKRLPTELEWQYAAQGGDGRIWPWGGEFDSTRCNVGLDRPTPVDRHPTGASPAGVMDLVGNVWQLTNDVYDNGIYYYVIIRGGSYYDPTSSWWYVKGGPQPLDKTQMLLRISPGFERNATVGFRCAADR